VAGTYQETVMSFEREKEKGKRPPVKPSKPGRG
jgi:hypothetical protein